MHNEPQDTKLPLSPEEIAALCNRDFFFTKHAVTEKIAMLFSRLNDEVAALISISGKTVPPEVKEIPFKITRGENYQRLPWIVLDYPRYFKPEAVFAFRTMCWWGEHFSFTLHLSGAMLERKRKSILENSERLKGHHFHFCIHSSPWQHHFREDNYTSLDELLRNYTMEELLEKQKFIKLARRLAPEQHEKVAGYGKETYQILLEIL